MFVTLPFLGALAPPVRSLWVFLCVSGGRNLWGKADGCAQMQYAQPAPDDSELPTNNTIVTIAFRDKLLAFRDEIISALPVNC